MLHATAMHASVKYELLTVPAHTCRPSMDDKFCMHLWILWSILAKLPTICVFIFACRSMRDLHGTTQTAAKQIVLCPFCHAHHSTRIRCHAMDLVCATTALDHAHAPGDMLGLTAAAVQWGTSA